MEDTTEAVPELTSSGSSSFRLRSSSSISSQSSGRQSSSGSQTNSRPGSRIHSVVPLPPSSPTSPRLLPNPWASSGVTLLSLSDEPVPIVSLWENSRTVLFLERRFGCAFCHFQAELLMIAKPIFDTLGVNLVAVGRGTKYFAKKFAFGLPFTGSVYIDPDGGSYKALHLKKWSPLAMLQRFSWNVFSLGNKLMQRYSESTSLAADGAGTQSGGVFVIGPGRDGSIEYQFLESDAKYTEFADLVQILRVCGASEEAVQWCHNQVEERKQLLIV